MSSEVAKGSRRLPASLLKDYQELIYRRFGIHYIQAKVYILEAKLDKLSRRVGGESLEEFLVRLKSGEPEADRLLLREITVNHTFFFREESHFSVLAQDILTRKVRRPLIWCAASSTGEEPYSIVITLLEKGIQDFTLVSSDVDEKVLKVMHRGVYPAGRLSNTPRAFLHKYFKKVDADHWSVLPDLRRYLRIKRLNLHDTLRFEDQFDYVFCRNVMIYFDDVGRRKVVDNLVENLRVGGLFFVGHTEALLNTPECLKKEGQSLFRKQF